MEKHQHPQDGPLDYNYIAGGIYIGSNQCCVLGISEILRKNGIAADISLEDIRLDQPFGVEAYLWLPTPDHTQPSDDQMELGVVILQKLVALEKKVYVHCKNGHGRAPTLAAAYFIARGRSPDEAITLLKTQRTPVHLEDSQIETLRNFAIKIT